MSEQTVQQRRANPDARLSAASRLVVPVKDLECRAVDGDAAGRFTIAGHAAVFNDPSEVLYDWLGPFREYVLAGSLADVIEANGDGREDTKFLRLNPDRNHPLGRCGNDSLTLTEDGEGLAFEVTPAPTDRAEELRILLSERTVDQMSFTFTVTKDGEKWTWSDGMDRRDLQPNGCARLFDISPVVYPAYPQTDVGLRALGELRNAAEEIAAGRRSADPAILSAFGQALTTLQDVPAEIAERALRTLAARGPAPDDPEKEPLEARGGTAASRARRLRLRELAHHS